jgi:hypothetical protein
LIRLVPIRFFQRSKPPDICPAASFCPVHENIGAVFSMMAAAQARDQRTATSREFHRDWHDPIEFVCALMQHVASMVVATTDQ